MFVSNVVDLIEKRLLNEFDVGFRYRLYKTNYSRYQTSSYANQKNK